MFDMMQIGINDITQQEYDEAVLMLNVKKMHRVFDMQLKGDRLRSVAADIAARMLISKNTGIPFENITIDEDSCGRPFFEDIYISISHSEEFAVCAVSDSPVGVDIERIRPNIKKAISKKICRSDEETAFVNTGDFDERIIILWTVKEACFKALLPQPDRIFNTVIKFADGKINCEGISMIRYERICGDYILSVAFA